jgi:hypothetical protein
MNLPKISFKLPKVKIYGIDVIKNFLFFTLFIVLTLVFIAFIISPAVHSFKKSKTKYYKAKYSLEITTNEYKEKLLELKKLKNANRKILNALKRDLNKKNFKLFASKYMSISSIKETNSSFYQNDFINATKKYKIIQCILYISLFGLFLYLLYLELTKYYPNLLYNY